MSYFICIPEIIELIVNHLSHKDRVACLRVCKIFYTILIPNIWRDITVRPSSLEESGRNLNPIKSSLEKYKHYVTELHLENTSPLQYLALKGCYHLQTLTIKSSRAYPGTQDWQDFKDQILPELSVFIMAHASTLVHVGIDLPRNSIITPRKDFWDALAQCSKLDVLNLHGICIPNTFVSMLLQVLERGPQSLKFDSMEIPEWQVAISNFQDPSNLKGSNSPKSDFVIQGLHTLSIIESYSATPLSDPFHHSQAMLVRDCVNLKSLEWKGCDIDNDSWLCESSQIDDNASHFFKTITMDPWPLSQLESLSLPWVRVTDKELSKLLCQMNQLKELRVQGSLFGPLSLEAMLSEREVSSAGGGSGAKPKQRRLCDSVETLVLNKCRNVTSTMIQTLLSNCHNLKAFKADKITSRDIVFGEDWVCHGLEELVVHIASPNSCSTTTGSFSFVDMERIVFSRLSKLVKLKRLILTADAKFAIESKRTVSLRLDAGLGLLTDLKELRDLGFHMDLNQNIGLEEAQWMVESWPKLSSLRGQLNQDPETRHQLRSIFGQKRIVLQG
ncbi:hypothetical protein BGZ46_002995 [Entomortierella lignicola]|nr:hypothetical protein BGZ46_002995 [Entomortierella lignicola]